MRWYPAQIKIKFKRENSFYLFGFWFAFSFISFLVFWFSGRFVCWRPSWKSTLSVAKICVYTWRWPRPSRCLLHFVVPQQVKLQTWHFCEPNPSHPIVAGGLHPRHDISIWPNPNLDLQLGFSGYWNCVRHPGYPGLAFEFILCRVLTFGNALNCNLYKY